VRYREWYGSNGQANTGLHLTAEEVSKGIVEREGGDLYEVAGKSDTVYGILDPRCFANDGGPSIAERMFTAHHVAWRPADNARVPRAGAMGGWDQLRSRLIGTARRNEKTGEIDWSTGDPMIYFFSTCIDTIRTIPALPHDSHRPEDVDTEAEDHAADEVRYACMSRPFIKTSPDQIKTKVISTDPSKTTVTLTDMWEANERRHKRSGGRIA
jgi:hypothetical protein